VNGPRRILVTGGAGFIGSAVCRHLVASGYEVINLDKLTYAGNLDSLREVEASPNYLFRHVDICDEEVVRDILESDGVEAIMHLAAESHVDRSTAVEERLIARARRAPSDAIEKYVQSFRSSGPANLLRNKRNTMAGGTFIDTLKRAPDEL
jgi:dTDP-4-dehydrorhamnose reductase